MAINKSWSKRLHQPSDMLLKIFGSSLVDLITKNQGEFVGTYNEILKNAGLSYDITQPDNYYGDLFNDMKQVKTLYEIESKPMGSKGARYWFKGEVPLSMTISELKCFLGTIDFEAISDVEIKAVMNMVQRII